MAFFFVIIIFNITCILFTFLFHVTQENLITKFISLGLFFAFTGLDPTCCPFYDCWVILTTSTAFDYFRARRVEIRCAVDST